MADLRSIVDKIHYVNRRKYTKKQGNIAYLDGTPLTRPSMMPRAQRVILLVFVIAAILIGFVLVNNFVIARWQQTISTEQTIANNLAREASIETVPNVASLIPMDNETIKVTFKNAGFTFYDATKPDAPNDLMLLKLPSDMTVEEAAAMYLQGIGSLNAEQASKLLNGSWYFGAERVNGTSMVVRYADFKNSDPQIAVQDAIVRQGFDPTTISDSGVDDSGNTFSSGTVDVNGTQCTWKVSALKLNEMYAVTGLPEGACYVGIRVTDPTPPAAPAPAPEQPSEGQ